MSEQSKATDSTRKRGCSQKDVPKVNKRKKITVNTDVRKLPSRECLHAASYCEIEKPRGRAGGYKSTLRSIRNLQDEKERNRVRNAKVKEQARQRTMQKRLETKFIFQQALEALKNVVTTLYVCG